MLISVAITPAEQTARALSAENLAEASRALRTHGCVMLRDVLAPEHIAAMREEVLARNPPLQRAERPEISGRVGNRRFMAALELSGPFGSPDFFANPFALPVLRAVVGPEMVIGAFGAVTSLPGAQDQHVHFDGPPLFNKAINRLAPAHAVNFFVPLVEFNASTGTTRLFPGTHLDVDRDVASAPFVDPIIPVGSCLLMDYRLKHQGLANRSELVRPLLYTVFQQPWFKDYKNHGRVPFLRLSDADYARMAEEHRALFSWTEHYRNGLY